MFLKSRKGFLDIGVNFAVLMIIGLIVLGLIVFFMLRSFNYAEDTAPKNVPDIWFHASNENPVLVQEDEISVAAGKKTTLLVSVFNNRWSDQDDIILSLDQCKDVDGIAAYGFGVSAISQKITMKDDKGYQAMLSVDSDVVSGQYICTVLAGLQAEDGSVDTQFAFHSSQFSVTVE